MAGALAQVGSVVRALGEDVGWAGRHLLLTGVGGSPYVPRAGRRWVYTLAGARMRSAPGPGFVFNGDPANLEVGANVYFNQGVFVDAMGPVTIGDDCGIGMQALLLTSYHEWTGVWSPEVEGRGITIGNRVAIGARTVVLPGTVIEDDVAIAAGCVVLGRLRAGGRYATRPATRIKEVRAPEPAEGAP